MTFTSIHSVRSFNSRRLITVILALLVCGVSSIWARGYHRWHRPQIIEFDEAQLFLEENATDGDLGIHFKVDGDPWDRLYLYSPHWRQMVNVRVRGSSGVIGLTELFNESAEPSFDDLPREDFLALFPEGEYKFFGKTIEGDWLVGLAELSHTMPDQPVVLSPEEEEEVDASESFTIEWEPVADPPGSEIVAILAVVEKDEDDERVRVLSAEMTPDDTTFTVAPGFLEPGKAYKVEILVEESSGNKIITEVEFETEE